VGLQISIRECGDVSILDLRGRSTIDDGESDLLSGHLKKLVDTGVRKLLPSGVMVGAVGIEIASQISKPHRNKVLPTAPTVNCCQMLPTQLSGYARRISPR
jgi:hypothetical protein